MPKEDGVWEKPYCMAASGMLLEKVEEIIKMALSLGTAEQRYEARKNPVKIIFRTECTEQELVIIKVKLEDNNIVFLLNREF